MPIPLGPKKGIARHNDDQMQEVLDRLQRLMAMTADDPIEIQKNGDCFHFKLRRNHPCWVKITGHATQYSGTSGAAGSGNLPGNHYAGIEQESRIGLTASVDLTAGLKFNKEFPLFAMDGNTEVPVGALVYATPSLGGTHYEFVWANGTMACSEPDQSGCSGGSGSGVPCKCGVRLSDLFVRLNDSCAYEDKCITIKNGKIVIDDVCG